MVNMHFRFDSLMFVLLHVSVNTVLVPESSPGRDTICCSYFEGAYIRSKARERATNRISAWAVEFPFRRFYFTEQASPMIHSVALDWLISKGHTNENQWCIPGSKWLFCEWSSIWINEFRRRKIRMFHNGIGCSANHYQCNNVHSWKTVISGDMMRDFTRFLPSDFKLVFNIGIFDQNIWQFCNLYLFWPSSKYGLVHSQFNAILKLTFLND